MVVVGDVELLSGQSLVGLPDVQGLTVGSQVGSKVDAIVGVGISVGCNANLGATGVVYPLLEGEVGVVFGEAVATEAENPGIVRDPMNKSMVDSQCDSATVPQLDFRRARDDIHLKAKFRPITLPEPSDLPASG